MTGTRQDPAARRARWRAYFEQTLTGPDSEVEAAVEAAMAAVARGAQTDQIVAAGRAAARRERLLRAGAPRRPDGPAAPHRPSPQQPSAPPSQPAGSADRPAQPRRPATQGASAPPRVWPPNSGVVTMMEKRSESLDGQFFQTWSFRLYRLEDGVRPTPPAIPVEIRGRSIIGALAKGDVVEIPYGRPDQTRIVKTLRNLSTGTEVEAKGRPFRRFRTLRRTLRMLLASLGALVVLGGIAAGVLYWLTQIGVVTW